jgi:hypothetical protein
MLVALAELVYVAILSFYLNIADEYIITRLCCLSGKSKSEVSHIFCYSGTVYRDVAEYSHCQVVATAYLDSLYETLTSLIHDRPRLDKFVEERTDSVVTITQVCSSRYMSLYDYSNSLTQHANLCESWHQSMSMDRQEQLQDLKERRKEA